MLLGQNVFYADQFYNTSLGGVDSIAEGLQSVPAERADSFFSFAIRNEILRTREDHNSGIDLPAVNINRARDIGLQGYNAYRQVSS